jgi:hypothetical protein
MANAHKTLENYVLATRVIAALLTVLMCTWITIYPLPDISMKWLAFGSGVIFAFLGLSGLWRLRRQLFLISSLALAVMHVMLAVGTALTTIQHVLAASLLLLIAIFLIELGSSSMLYSRIMRNIKEPSDTETISRIKKTVRRHLIDITAIVVMTFFLSCALLFLGSITIPTVMPSYIVAAEIALLLVSIALLSSKRNTG